MEPENGNVEAKYLEPYDWSWLFREYTSGAGYTYNGSPVICLTREEFLQRYPKDNG